MGEYIFKKEDFPWGENEERIIISLALDMPEYFNSVQHLIEPEHFRQPDARFIIREIKALIKKYDHVPARSLVEDHIKSVLTTDHDWEPIVKLIGRDLAPREAPMIRDRVVGWAKQQQIELLYSEPALAAVGRGDIEALVAIVEKARAMGTEIYDGIWIFDSIDEMFSEEVNEKLTCGFPTLDSLLNNGGPSRQEALAWMAPTNVGKTIVLCNCGVQACRAGYNVLHVTLETSPAKVRRRYIGALTETNLLDIDALSFEPDSDVGKEYVARGRQGLKDNVKKETSGAGSAFVVGFPAYSISSLDIAHAMDYLRKTKDWEPDVVIVDYLELVNVARVQGGDRESKEYLAQKHVSTELRSLAQKENVLVITATQGNRSSHASANNRGGGKGVKDEQLVGQPLDLDKIADSFAKAMPLDYVISINQNPSELKISEDPHIGKFRFYVAKNRNGPKRDIIHAKVNYDNMLVVEEEHAGVVKVS